MCVTDEGYSCPLSVYVRLYLHAAGCLLRNMHSGAELRDLRLADLRATYASVRDYAK